MDEAAFVNSWANNLDLESARYRDLAFKLDKQDRSSNRTRTILFSAGIVGSGVTLVGVFLPDSPELVTAGLGLSTAAIGLVAASNIADTVIKRKILNETRSMVEKDKSSVWKALQYLSRTGQCPVPERKIKIIYRTIEYLEPIINKDKIVSLLKVAFSIKIYFDKLIDMYNIILKGSNSISVIDEDVVGVIVEELQKQQGMSFLYGLYLYIKTSLRLVRSASRSNIKVSGVVVLSLFAVYLTQLISSLRSMKKSSALVTAMRDLSDKMEQQEG